MSNALLRPLARTHARKKWRMCHLVMLWFAWAVMVTQASSYCPRHSYDLEFLTSTLTITPNYWLNPPRIFPFFHNYSVEVQQCALSPLEGHSYCFWYFLHFWYFWRHQPSFCWKSRRYNPRFLDFRSSHHYLYLLAAKAPQLPQPSSSKLFLLIKL